MCGWTAFQDIKVTPVPTFEFEKFLTVRIRQPITIANINLVYPDSFVETGGDALGHACVNAQSCDAQVCQREVEQCGNIEITQEPFPQQSCTFQDYEV